MSSRSATEEQASDSTSARTLDAQSEHERRQKLDESIPAATMVLSVLSVQSLSGRFRRAKTQNPTPSNSLL